VLGCVARSVALVAAAALFLVSACRSARDIERDDLRENLTPTPLEASTAATASTAADRRPAKRLLVRLYADEDAQRSAVGWQIKAHRRIESANVFLRARFGVELSVVEALPWPGTHRTEDLEAVLGALESFDPAADVDLLIAMTTALPIVSSTEEQLGRARLFRPHVVLRGFDDLREVEALARRLQHLPEEERDALYEARLEHKAAVVLLHEIGHALGADHDDDEDSIMNPLYGPHRARFNEPAAAKIARRLAQIRERRSAPSHRVLVRPNADPEAAWAELAPLAKEQPDALDVQRAACALAAELGRMEDLLSTCARAASLAPDDPLPRLREAWARSRRGEGDRAYQLLVEADRLLLDDAPAEQRILLGGLYLALDAPSLAEHAAAAAKEALPEEARPILDEARARRARIGLTGVAPEREREYIARLGRVRTDLGAGRFAVAEKGAAELGAAFPGAAGAALLLCEKQAEARRFAAAEPHCKAAIARDPRAVRPRAVLGFLSLALGRARAAIAPLEAAIALDPDQRDLWPMLATAYRLVGLGRAKEALASRFRQRFGEPLP
jgi:predicted Zn-dependent protease